MVWNRYCVQLEADAQVLERSRADDEREDDHENRLLPCGESVSESRSVIAAMCGNPAGRGTPSSSPIAMLASGVLQVAHDGLELLIWSATELDRVHPHH